MLSPDLQIDDYVLGRLDGEAANRFEAALAADHALRDKVDEAAGLIGRLHALGQEILEEPVPEVLLRLVGDEAVR